MQNGAAEFIYSHREQLAGPAVRASPGNVDVPQDAKCCHGNLEQHLLYLAEAVRFEAPELFIDYVGWCKIIATSRGTSVDGLRESLERLKVAVGKTLSAEVASLATDNVQGAIDKLPSLPDSIPSKIDPETEHGQMAQDYLGSLLSGERRRALAYILELVGKGIPTCDLFDNVLTPALHEIGRLWQTGAINEAQEHYSAALTDQIIAVVSGEIRPPIRRETVVGLCVVGEQHSLGLRLVLESFATCGWNPIVVGADTPATTLDWMVTTWKPTVIAISASMTYHLRELLNAVNALRAICGDSCPKIMVGGRPFVISPDLWRKIGADMTANTCRELTDLCDSIR